VGGQAGLRGKETKEKEEAEWTAAQDWYWWEVSEPKLEGSEKYKD
jgi:hypothetical protein